MSQENVKLSEKQKQLLDRFTKSAQKDSDNDLCIPMYRNDNAKLTLFEEDTKSYQPYAYKRIMRLIKKGIFFIKIKKIKKDKKFLCMKQDVFSKLKSQFES